MNFLIYKLCMIEILISLTCCQYDDDNIEVDESSIEVDESRVVRGTGYEYPRHSEPLEENLSSRWLIVAGRQVVPSSVYRVVVETFRRNDADSPITFRASISRNKEQIASAKSLVQAGETSYILLRIPDTVVQGKWELRVDGREGDNQLPVFKNTTILRFTPNFLTIFIQTSRPVYNAAQTARFRVAMLTREMKPYDNPVDIYIYDSKGIVMRRWPSHQAGDGIANMEFTLPEFPVLGNWTIQVRAHQQVQEKTILVEQYFRPRFEVFVRLPQEFKWSQERIEGVVVANRTNWRDVQGNCTVMLQVAVNNDYPVPSDFKTVDSQITLNFTGYYSFSFSMNSLLEYEDMDNNLVIRTFATVGDSYLWQIEQGWAMSRIVQKRAKVTILGDKPLFFKPGMPLHIHVQVSYEENHPIENEKLQYSELTVMFSSTQIYIESVNGTKLMKTSAIHECVTNVPEDAEKLEISASFITKAGLSASTSLTAILHHSPRKEFIKIETSTTEANAGENLIIHVRSNFYARHINYLLSSNGLILYNDREAVRELSAPSLTTISITVSADMIPVVKILVWTTNTLNEVLSDSIAIPVSPITRHKVSVRWNEEKDHSGGSAEIKMIGETGAFFASSALWEETFLMDAGNDLDEVRVVNHMLGFHESNTNNFDFENLTPHIRRFHTRSPDGFGSRVHLYTTPYSGPDSPSAFNFSDVILMTDAMLYYHPAKASDAIPCEKGDIACMTGGCYSKTKQCDGIEDCEDASDETGCPINFDPLRGFRLHRISRLHRFYDPVHGDWAWRDVRTIRKEVQVFPIPKRAQSWVYSMFAIGREHGIGLLQEKIHFDSPGPFLLNIEGPKTARMWEQVAITVSVFNFFHRVVGVFLTIPSSDEYQVILVEKNGIVKSYNPRRVENTHQHLVWLKGGESQDVNIPVVFKKMGKLRVTVYGNTQMQKDQETLEIEIIPEGAIITQHASFILDLKSRSLAYNFIDIHLDETPEVHYQIKRNYIYGTTSGTISVTGDIVGPTFPEVPVNENNMLGFGSFGAETYSYNFASNIWMLHYLRLTNQLNNELLFKVLTSVNVDYAALTRFQNDDGGFSNWIGSENSVWLTAYVLKNLWAANFQDWENLLFVDHAIIRKGLEWLLKYQTNSGSFHETHQYIHPLHSKINPKSNKNQSSTMHDGAPEYQNISLTAHVLITLETVKPGIDGDIQNRASLASKRAMRYLEKLVETITDPYDMAVVNWALIKANSKEKKFAFSSLDRMKRTERNFVYWSKEPIEFATYIVENSQKPFLQVKQDSVYDAYAVEASSYALLAYIKDDGIGIIQEKIVKFLNSMREMDGGVISSIDSLVALEALVKYSFRARIRDITDMKIEIHHTANPQKTFEAHFTHKEMVAKTNTFELHGIYGQLEIIGRGAGQSLVQLSYSYGVDIPGQLNVPPIDSFEMDIMTRFSGRNQSYIDVRSCQRWIATKEREASGVTVVEIHCPSGYYIMQDKLIAMVDSRIVRNLRWAKHSGTNVKFFFNSLDAEPICLSYRLERWFPVSNHSRYNKATVYELYQPERFVEKLYEVYPLYSLDICEVCGSYQCPYCPFYSGTWSIKESNIWLTLCIIYVFKILYFTMYYKPSTVYWPDF